MPAAYPQEFRDDVVAVARKGDMPIARAAKDFGITESCLRRWLSQDDVEAGTRPGVTRAENEDLKKARRRVRELEMENERGVGDEADQYQPQKCQQPSRSQPDLGIPDQPGGPLHAGSHRTQTR